VKPYYQDDAVTIYHGDSWAVAGALEADAVVCDPPYGVGVAYGDGYDDSRSDYWDWMREMVNVLRRPKRPLVFTHRVTALRELVGWDWVGVWNKPGSFGSRLGNSPVLPQWEPIFMYDIHGMGLYGEARNDVFEFNPKRAGSRHGKIGREKWSAIEHGQHPCPKPDDLMRALVVAFSRPGATVMDPFAGSGTTLRAAKDLGRKAIGIEIEERYCEIAARRCSQEVFALGDEGER
jgi:site-specific DNA-methyltransferase (adenine-specific)